MRLSIDNTDSGPRSESGPGRQAGDAGRLTGASGDGARCGEISRDPGRDSGSLARHPSRVTRAAISISVASEGEPSLQ